jgi:hypothetical protein
MSPTSALKRIALRLRRGEDGLAVPTVLAMVMIATAFVAITITASVTSERGSVRDSRSKSALSSADAGLSVALLRQNRYQTSSANPCIILSGSTLTTGPAAGDGWCPAITGTVGGVGYSYRVSPANGVSPITMVSTSTNNGVVRKTAVGASPQTGSSMLAEEPVIGQNNFTLSGNPSIEVNVGTNGSVELGGSSSICGNIRHGVGHYANFAGSSGQCPGNVITEENRIVPPIVLPAGITTTNSNGRLVACTAPNTPSSDCGKDTYSKSRSSTTPWDPVTRSINIGSNATMTIGGGDYFICQLNMDNGDMIMPAGANVRFFFDTPENCGIPSGGSQISMNGNAKIQSTGFDPAHGVFNLPGFYVQGSPNIPTTVTLGGNSGTNEFIVYAPQSDITLQGNSTVFGYMAGKTLTMSGNPTISSITGAPPLNFSTTATYRRDRYVECTASATGAPNAGC